MNHEETIKQLQAQGGYSITHTCLLVRTDESHFAYSDARQALSGLAFLLALVRRAWSSPVVLVAQGMAGRFGSVGTRCLTRINGGDRRHGGTSQRTTSWMNSRGQCSTRSGATRMTPRVTALLGTQVKRTEASVEAPLILSQTALELLAWHVTVRHESAFASRRYASEARSCISTTRRPGSPGTGSAPIQDAATTAGRAETSSQR